MPVLVGLVLVIGVLCALRDFLVFGIALITSIVAAYHCIKKLGEARRAEQYERDAEASRIAAEAARAAEAERQRRQLQLNYRSQLQAACDGASNAYADIPRSLLDTENLLDRAQRDFEESAFSPFWESVEGVVHKLATVDKDVRQIQQSIHAYGENAQRIEGAVERFPVDLADAKGLVAANNTGERLKAIVRQAQRNFQFASIFEQRKTTQVLIIGFNTLGEALEGVGHRISSAVDSLCDQVGALESNMERNISRLQDGIESSLQESRDMQERQMEAGRDLQAKLASEESEQRNRLASQRSDQAKKQLAMLDNIQRGRTPGYFEDRP